MQHRIAYVSVFQLGVPISLGAVPTLSIAASIGITISPVSKSTCINPFTSEKE